MKIIKSIVEFRSLRQRLKGSIGFVPTMGYLHAGHIALAHEARKENATVVASIFVNPTQFGPNEDLDSYPRDLESDTDALEKAGTDFLYFPSAEEIYPPTFDTYVDVGTVTETLEGAKRPTHFRGVATVVTKLFNIVQPHRAYFGQKDGQQVIVIRKMVDDLNIPVEIITVPTVREPDGLALSSRNSYLNKNEREAATILHQSLIETQNLYNNGQRDAEKLREAMRNILASQPLAHIEYVSIADIDTLHELSVVGHDAIASLAVRIGKTHLIDNVLLLQ
jgi:pantoate--beta-alanine ligase